MIFTWGVYFRFASFLIFVARVPNLVVAHGLVTIPRQRGALRVRNRLVGDIDPDAPFDPAAHYPAGDKNSAPGSGKRSVMKAASNFWIPYEPLRDDFKWRAGVCGDDLYADQEHLKGGKYYYPASDPFRVNTYNQGDVVDFEVNIVSHHNGYFEFYICNLDVCGEEISVACFRRGYCEQLMRAPSFCDSGDNKHCGPIDSLHRGRWYLPCGLFPKGQSLYGGVEKGSMKFQLPRNLHCDHCVIQWYWTAANTCNPPGVVDYFEGPDGPHWPSCRGQGGAIGGYTTKQRECGGENFPEEYWQCSDIRIVANFASTTAGEKKGATENKRRGNRGSGAQDLHDVTSDSSHSSPVSPGMASSAGSFSASLSNFMNFGREHVKKPGKTSTGSGSLENSGKRRKSEADGPEQGMDSQTNSGEGKNEVEQQHPSELSTVPTSVPTTGPNPMSKAFPQETKDMLNNAFNSGFSLLRNRKFLAGPFVPSKIGVTSSSRNIEKSGEGADGLHEKASTKDQFIGYGTSQTDIHVTQTDNKFLPAKTT